MFNFWTGYTILPGWGQFTLNNPLQFMKSITCSKIEHIPYNLILTTKLNDSSILITIISWDYLNLLLANEYVGNVTIPTQVIKYNQCCSRWLSQSDCSTHIKLNYYQWTKGICNSHWFIIHLSALWNTDQER